MEIHGQGRPCYRRFSMSRLAARLIGFRRPMKTPFRFLLAAGGMTLVLRAEIPAPRSWIDPDTGHRVVQLSTEPRSACLYFTQYGYTAGGTKLLMTTPKGIDLVTLKTGEIEH